MTIFSERPYSRRIERLMTAIPNFKPRGVGFRFTKTQTVIAVGIAASNGILHSNLQYMFCSGAEILGRTAVVRRTGTGGFANHFRQKVIRQTCLCQYRKKPFLSLRLKAITLSDVFRISVSAICSSGYFPLILLRIFITLILLLPFSV